MAVLVIQAPDGSSRSVFLEDRPVVIGSGPDADVALPGPDVSARHARLRPLEDGGFVLRDLGSDAGTRVGGRIVLRAYLGLDDTFEVGGTRLSVRETAPPPRRAGPVVGGTLDLRPVAAPSAAPPATDAPADVEPAAAEPAPRGAAPRSLLDVRALERASVVLALGLAAVAAVFAFLVPAAAHARARADARRDLRQVLENLDLAPDTFEVSARAYLAEHADGPEAAELQAYLAAVRAREAERARRQARLVGLTQDLYGLPESEVRGALIDLASGLPKDDDLARQVALALEGLDRRHEAAQAAALDAVLGTVRSRIAAGDPAGALRRLAAFEKAWPAVSSADRPRYEAATDEAVAAVEALSTNAIAEAEKTTDPVERRRILAKAWRGLEGTPQGDRIADALRYTRMTGRRTPTGPTPSTAPPGPTPAPAETPEVPPEVLARASAADELARQRHWAAAGDAFRALVEEAPPRGRLAAEWTSRAGDLARLTALVDGLVARAGGPRPIHARLGSAHATVTAADADGVTFAVGAEARRLAWPEIPDDALLQVLAPPQPTPADRLGVGVLAASLGKKDELVKVLVPLFEKGEEVAAAGDLVARFLYGRARPPADGYRVYKGEILDPETYTRRVRDERVAALRDTATRLFARVEKDPGLKKLEKLRALRAQLDERRRYALLAIFDEVHYPYPADKASRPYQEVQKEIDRRVAAAREIWDDPFKVMLHRKDAFGRLLDDWDRTLGELRAEGDDVSDLEARMKPISDYVTDTPITIHEFWKDDAERALLAYNRWVMDVYNPARVAEATAAEREQTRITNEYRALMGFTATVRPGPGLYDAIDEKNVQKILDEGRIEATLPLYAVRIDDRLVRSARGHSIDMDRRGYFAHYAPPDPATGAPSTSPFDRIQAAGYEGGGASENIATGPSNGQQAHDMWVHSSGHHRNILSGWTDQGVGVSGRLWTQNFGVGGGAPPEIPADAERPPPGDAGRSAGGAGGPRRPGR